MIQVISFPPVTENLLRNKIKTAGKIFINAIMYFM